MRPTAAALFKQVAALQRELEEQKAQAEEARVDTRTLSLPLTPNLTPICP